MLEKRPEEFIGSDFIPFVGYPNYIDRNFSEVKYARALSLVALHYGLYLQGVIATGALFVTGLENLFS